MLNKGSTTNAILLLLALFLVGSSFFLVDGGYLTLICLNRVLFITTSESQGLIVGV